MSPAKLYPFILCCCENLFVATFAQVTKWIFYIRGLVWLWWAGCHAKGVIAAPGNAKTCPPPPPPPLHDSFLPIGALCVGLCTSSCVQFAEKFKSIVAEPDPALMKIKSSMKGSGVRYSLYIENDLIFSPIYWNEFRCARVQYMNITMWIFWVVFCRNVNKKIVFVMSSSQLLFAVKKCKLRFVGSKHCSI